MKFTNFDNCQIRYSLIDGCPDKPYLVFLHEGLGCIEMWKQFPENLCRQTGCPGLLYDRQGYGQSSPLTNDRDIDYVHQYAQTELSFLLDTILNDRSCILVGHSDGGSIALIYGAAYRPRLKAIVTIAAHVFVEKKTAEGIQLAYNKYLKQGAPGLIKYHGNKTDAIFRDWAEVWLSDWFRSWNLETLLPKIRCPVLAVQGADDEYGTAKQVESIVSCVTGPAEPLIIENCGHVPHLKCEDTVLAAANFFIDRYV